MRLLRTFLYSVAFVVGALGSMAFAAELPQAPDPKLTPGVVDPSATLDKICVPGYTSQPGVRNVSEATKKQVFAEYGVDPKADQFEVDHLISLELGGSNDIRNLWPQAYNTHPWNAHVKDKLENHLHKLVCDKTITLAQAQKEISTDWIAAYKKYLGNP